MLEPIQWRSRSSNRQVGLHAIPHHASEMKHNMTICLITRRAAGANGHRLTHEIRAGDRLGATSRPAIRDTRLSGVSTPSLLTLAERDIALRLRSVRVGKTEVRSYEAVAPLARLMFSEPVMPDSCSSLI
jgi:hypothetical protein